MDPLDNIWQVAIALIVIVALVTVLGVVARKMQGINKGSNGTLKIVDSIYLGPKERLVLVQVRKQQVLLGMHPQCITKLMELGPDEGFQDVLGEALQTDRSTEVAQVNTQTLERQNSGWLGRVLTNSRWNAA